MSLAKALNGGNFRGSECRKIVNSARAFSTASVSINKLSSTFLLATGT